MQAWAHKKLKQRITSKFKSQFKKINSPRDLEAFRDVATRLAKEEPLDPRCRPHKLTGDYSGLMECHLRPDLLLIYDVSDGVLTLYCIGSHAELF